jgi:hypothetical protein
LTHWPTHLYEVLIVAHHEALVVQHGQGQDLQAVREGRAGTLRSMRGCITIGSVLLTSVTA